MIAAAATAAATPYLPCVSATTPRLVADADLPGANAARSAMTGLGIIVGPALGGVLLLLGSPAWHSCSTGSRSAWRRSRCCPSPRAVLRPARPGRARGVLRDIAAGAAALRACPGALRLIGADVIYSVVYGMQTVLLLLVSR